jgi:hypothetical protein
MPGELLPTTTSVLQGKCLPVISSTQQLLHSQHHTLSTGLGQPNTLHLHSTTVVSKYKRNEKQHDTVAAAILNDAIQLATPFCTAARPETQTRLDKPGTGSHTVQGILHEAIPAANLGSICCAKGLTRATPHATHEHQQSCSHC